MNLHQWMKRIIPIVYISLFINACAITPYETSALKKIQWQVKANNTQSGQIVKRRLSSISNAQGKIYQVTVSHEKIRQRSIGVGKDGQPSTYLQEVLVRLQVLTNKKEMINEPTIVARELSKEDSATQITEQKNEMINELANDILLRLNDIVNQDKDALLHKNTYQELRDLSSEKK